jgi:hypothetical protein
MGGVEFIGSDDPPLTSDDDLVELGRPRRPSRLLWPIAVLAAGGLVAGFVLTHSADRKSAAHPRALHVAVVPRVTPAPPVPVVRLGTPFALEPRPVLDVAVEADSTWVLRAGYLDGFMQTGDDVRVRVPRIRFGDPKLRIRLVVDEPHLWVVAGGEQLGQVEEFAYNLHSLRFLRSVVVAHGIAGAAALHGHLYLATGSGLTELPPAGRPRQIALPGLHGGANVVAADPMHWRLIVIDFGLPTHVWSYPPGGRAVGGGALPLGKGTLAVTGRGQIWIGGYGSTGAVLVRLDPRTLRPTRSSELVHELGPGADIVGSGDRVFWIGGGPMSLYCVAGTDGGVGEVWPGAVGAAGPGPVGSRRGMALAVTDAGAVSLPMHGCAG